MKSIYLLPVLFLLFPGCKKDVIDQLPANISKLQPIENLSDSLKYVLAENGNAKLNNPFLFSDTIQKNIILSMDSKVYVTFIDAETSKKNTLCWYSYNLAEPPTGTNDIHSNVIFPNASKIGTGGLLESGYTVELGSEVFTAGTVIGFSLIANGWNDGTIDFGRATYYTNYSLNPEGDQLHVLFKNLYSHYIVVGFEDNLSAGRDYNDVLIAVSDNDKGYEASSFDLSRMVVK